MTKFETYVDDEDLGRIRICRSARARLYSIKIIHNEVILTLPANGNESMALDFLEGKKSWIKAHLTEKNNRIVFDENVSFQTYTFSVKMLPFDGNSIYFSLKEGVLNILYPKNVDIMDESNQSIVKNGILKVMCSEAKRVLPSRLEMLANQHGFSFSSISVREMRSRWGSCSSLKKISLSCFLMLLPEHLIDYVLLHELCHTREMNHGPKFWQLLDLATNGNARKMRSQIKNYHTDF